LRNISQALPFRGYTPAGGGADVVQQRRTGTDSSANPSKYVGVGLTMALATGLFLFIGVRADRWLGTAPWLTLAGTFVGAAAGFWYMYYHLVVEPQQRKGREE
jgi:F0F1-type ATP synthase assembly protein I